MTSSTQSPRQRAANNRRLLERLSHVESQDTTFLDPSSQPAEAKSAAAAAREGEGEGERDGPEHGNQNPWPIVMRRASGTRVTDTNGKRYLDMTACFGVLALGHRHPSALTALRKQSARLIHGMGDVHPSEAKIHLLESLCKWLPWDAPRAVLGLSGSDAMEAAVKTAMLATGRNRFVAFAGGYHGLTFGALRLTDRNHFHEGFESWSRSNVSFVPFPLEQNPQMTCGKTLVPQEFSNSALGEGAIATANEVLDRIGTELHSKEVAAVVLEPIQGRAGERTFPAGFVAAVRNLCQATGTLLIADEIYTGFGRTGKTFGMEHHTTQADLMTVGKALGGGLPLSACTGPAAIMDHWPRSTGEARHTQTFLGHPLGCAVGCATLRTLRTDLPLLSETLPAIESLLEQFLAHERKAKRPPGLEFEVRGSGWMRGFWFFRAPEGFGAILSRRLLAKGFLTLPSGPTGKVLSWTPPLNISIRDTQSFLRALRSTLDEI